MADGESSASAHEHVEASDLHHELSVALSDNKRREVATRPKFHLQPLPKSWSNDPNVSRGERTNITGYCTSFNLLIGAPTIGGGPVDASRGQPAE